MVMPPLIPAPNWTPPPAAVPASHQPPAQPALAGAEGRNESAERPNSGGAPPPPKGETTP
jgi:hypothetical protein